MSDIMLLGVLRMPPECWSYSSFDEAQRHSMYKRAADVIEILRTAINKTLDDNAHLADGENCTLLALKIALRETGEPWEGD